MIGLHKDKVELYPYCADWVYEYEKEKEILLREIGNYIIDIQHVGSTSIPGLSAKPIIDIAVAVANKDKLKELIPVLSAIGYDVKDSIEDLGEVLARKGSPEYRTHYIHIEIIGSEFWNNHLLFRDYLIKYPQYIKEYEAMKREVYKIHKDRKSYTSAKNEFIKKILKLAEIEFQK